MDERCIGKSGKHETHYRCYEQDVRCVKKSMRNEKMEGQVADSPPTGPVYDAGPVMTFTYGPSGCAASCGAQDDPNEQNISHRLCI